MKSSFGMGSEYSIALNTVLSLFKANISRTYSICPWKKRGCRDTQRRWVKCLPSQGMPEVGKSKEVLSPRIFRGSLALSASWFQTSVLQNCERMHFCCFKSRSLWYFLMATLGNYYEVYDIFDFWIPCIPLELQNMSISVQHGTFSPFPNAWHRTGAQ